MLKLIANEFNVLVAPICENHFTIKLIKNISDRVTNTNKLLSIMSTTYGIQARKTNLYKTLLFPLSLTKCWEVFRTNNFRSSYILLHFIHML